MHHFDTNMDEFRLQKSSCDEGVKNRYTNAMKFFFALSLALCCLVLGMWHVQAMTSVNYSIPWDTVNSGGNELGVSTNYQLYDTVGQPVSGSSTSTNFALHAGYRAGMGTDTALSFSVGGQAASPVSAYSLFSNVESEHVELDSAVGFSIGDYVAVVENQGYGALVAVGRVIGIVANILTIDRWEGDAALMSPIAAGGNDFVYNLSSDGVPFGTITVGSEHTAVVGGAVFSSASSGHTVYAQADGSLRTAGGASISDVSDGTVSSSAEEYGVESIGARAVSAGTDLAVTTTQRAISENSVATTDEDRFLLLFKLGATSSTLPGTYGQTVHFTLTSNF